MADLGRILVADDEETFLHSTADLLRREGYECDCVSDGVAATEALCSEEYDLLIADIRMPGNPQLELIKNVPHIAEGMPVILVTGYPSLKSAIQSIQLPVSTYLVKPVDFDELLVRVQASIEKFRIHRTVRGIRQNLQRWYDDLTAIEEAMIGAAEEPSTAAVSAFFELSFRNIVGALSDIKLLAEAFVMHTTDQEPIEPCHLLNCPRLEVMRDALVETIGVLEKTKSAFKSRDLGELRQRLEGMSALRRKN